MTPKHQRPFPCNINAGHRPRVGSVVRGLTKKIREVERWRPPPSPEIDFAAIDYPWEEIFELGKERR